MTTYNWSIQSMTCMAQDGGNTDVVYCVGYSLTAANDDGSASASGTVGIPLSSDTFTPYDQLTQDQVVGWVQAALGAEQVTGLQDALANQIAEKKNPLTTVSSLPWVNAT
jgi:hypothetical protein